MIFVAFKAYHGSVFGITNIDQFIPFDIWIRCADRLRQFPYSEF
jgi:hypothetical protein